MPVVLGVVAAVLAGTVAGLTAYNSGVAAGDRHYAPVVAERDELRVERDGLRAELDDVRAEQEAAEAQAAARPDLEVIADRVLGGSGLDYDGTSESLTVTMNYLGAAELTTLLDELGFSPAVIDRMWNTRALDGTQEAEGHNCNVTWTYHPDDGLQMVFETD